jgi:hypothetical protein
MLLYRSCYWLGLVIRSVQLVQKLGAATVRSGSRPATVGYRFGGMLCFAVLQAEGGDGRWEVKGQRIGGGGSSLCHVDEEPHATPHFTDATSPLGSWPERPW